MREEDVRGCGNRFLSGGEEGKGEGILNIISALPLARAEVRFGKTLEGE